MKSFVLFIKKLLVQGVFMAAAAAAALSPPLIFAEARSEAPENVDALIYLKTAPCDEKASKIARFVLTRHGETDTNKEECVGGGGTNGQLTKKGITQATDLGTKLSKAGIRIDEAITSPLDRAKDTLQYILKAYGNTSLPQDENPSIIEKFFGRYDGAPKGVYNVVKLAEQNGKSKLSTFEEKQAYKVTPEEIANYISGLKPEQRAFLGEDIELFKHEGYAAATDDKDSCFESLEEVYNRTVKLLREKAGVYQGKNVLVSTHNVVMRDLALNLIHERYPELSYDDINVTNCGLLVVEIGPDGKMELKAATGLKLKGH